MEVAAGDDFVLVSKDKRVVGNIKDIGITEAELEEIKKFITDHYEHTKFVEE